MEQQIGQMELREADGMVELRIGRVVVLLIDPAVAHDLGYRMMECARYSVAKVSDDPARSEVRRFVAELLRVDRRRSGAGGKARAAVLSPEQRSEIARKGAAARWGNGEPQSA